MPTATELIMYNPIDLTTNGHTEHDTLERTYQTTMARTRRKFTNEDISLLNGLYLERTTDGSYARTIAQLQEDFRMQTGKTISRASVYNKIPQTRKSRSRAIVLATPTAIEVYNGRSNGFTTTPHSTVSEEELGRLQNATDAEEAIGVYQDLGNRTREGNWTALEHSLEAFRDRQKRTALGRMRFYRNKGDWGELDNIYKIGMLWFNVGLWANRIQDQKLRELYLKVYLPVALVVQSELVQEYTLASKERNRERNPNLFRKLSRLVLRR